MFSVTSICVHTLCCMTMYGVGPVVHDANTIYTHARQRRSHSGTLTWHLAELSRQVQQNRVADPACEGFGRQDARSRVHGRVSAALVARAEGFGTRWYGLLFNRVIKACVCMRSLCMVFALVQSQLLFYLLLCSASEGQNQCLL